MSPRHESDRRLAADRSRAAADTPHDACEPRPRRDTFHQREDGSWKCLRTGEVYSDSEWRAKQNAILGKVATPQKYPDVSFAITEPTTSRLETDSAARKDMPIHSGVMRYFPDALAEIAKLSKVGSDKHHPGEPLH